MRFPASAPVHLKVVEARSCAVSHRTPSPVAHPASGPWATAAVQRNPPPDFTSVSLGTTFEAVEASNDPPPVRNTAPVGKPLTVPLNPKPLRAPRAWAAAADASGRPEAEYDGLTGVVDESLHATAARAATTSIPAVIAFIPILLVDDDGARCMDAYISTSVQNNSKFAAGAAARRRRSRPSRRGPGCRPR